MENLPYQILLSCVLMFGVLNGIKTSRVADTACQQMYMRPGRAGQRCITDTEVYRNYTDLPQERCMWHCLRDLSCNVINYNDGGSYCLVGHGPCVSLEPDSDFLAIPITIDEPCMSWVQQDTIPSSTDRTSIINFLVHPYSTVDDNTVLVTRAIWGSHRIPGRYHTRNSAGWYTLNGQELWFSAGSYEVLTMSHRCKASWVSYDSGSGNGLPPGSVIGGSHNGDPLYLVRLFYSPINAYLMGYYNNRDRMGQVGNNRRVMTFTTMECLVVNK